MERFIRLHEMVALAERHSPTSYLVTKMMERLHRQALAAVGQVAVAIPYSMLVVDRVAHVTRAVVVAEEGEEETSLPQPMV